MVMYKIYIVFGLDKASVSPMLKYSSSNWLRVFNMNASLGSVGLSV